MNNITTKNYDSKYDCTKFILSILVLAIHSDLYPTVLYPWLRIAVPLFFILSSYFVFSNLRNSPVDKQKQIVKKFISRNLQLYFCWLVILLPITIYIRKELFLYNSLFENIKNIIQCLLFRSTFVASWFITATVLGFLIIYYLSKLIKNDFIIFLISLVAFCFVTLESSYTSVITGTFISSLINGYISIFGGLVLSYPAALLWIFIGKMMAEQKIKLESLWLLICLTICSCIGLFIEWKFVASLNGTYKNDSYFMLVPVCILLFLIIQKIPPVSWEPSVHLKRASTIIYVSHGSIVLIVSKLISIIFNTTSALLSFIITLLCCIIVYISIDVIIKKCNTQKIKKILKLLY